MVVPPNCDQQQRLREVYTKDVYIYKILYNMYTYVTYVYDYVSWKFHIQYHINVYIYIIIIGSQFSRKHHMSQVLWLYVQIILSSISKPEATCSELVLEIPQ